MNIDIVRMEVDFDEKAAGWDEFVENNTDKEFHAAIAGQIPETPAPLCILDLGSGTGQELTQLFQRAPNARVTCVDISMKMLEVLTQRMAAWKNQIHVRQASFVDLDYGQAKYDIILSSLAFHHFRENTKLDLYRRIKQGLKPGGYYIEGDIHAPTKAREEDALARYAELADKFPNLDRGEYHINIPFSLDTQRALFLRSGFAGMNVVWQRNTLAVSVVR